MQKILLFSLCIVQLVVCHAGRVYGVVTDDKGKPLPYASILIKGGSKGTTTNSNGKYFIELGEGSYIISAQFVGYARADKSVVVGKDAIELNFVLTPLQLSLKDVVVTNTGEDPAYEIIRNAIRKRKEYESPLDSFTCEAYIKTLFKTRSMKKRILGQKIDEQDWKEMGVDSVGKGIIYLSESFTKIAFKKPGDIKLEVLSGRESGSNGYGFNFPTFINFYNNNVNVLTTAFAPRGFISPISDGALNFYRYKYQGSFFEDNKEIHQIQVIPKRKFEPLFSGTINITEGDWRIHSLDLRLTKESQLEILDTLFIKQLHVPVSNSVWRTKDQSMYFAFKQLGIDVTGTFLNVYNKYELEPEFAKKYFNNVIVKYDTAVNKKSKAYWDTLRPVPLEPEEAKDYKIKDSAYQYRKDSVWTKAFIDSMRKSQGKITFSKIFIDGFSRSNYNPKKWTSFYFEPLIKQVQYNTVEGLNISSAFSIRRSFPKIKKQLIFEPHLRYGFSNNHFNAWASMRFDKNTPLWGSNDIDDDFRRSNWVLSGGKRVSQINNENPIRPIQNSIHTLLWQRNYMKIYENWFAQLKYERQTDKGFNYGISLVYEDRLPLENTTNYTILKWDNRAFTPNYPVEKLTEQFKRHQALIGLFNISWQPGQKFIQYPRYKMSLGSKYPTFTFKYWHGFRNLLGSDVDFSKWQLSLSDDGNLKLFGSLSYRAGIGGFINNNKVMIQDYQHFNGNRYLFAGKYLQTFQLAPYFANSTTAKFYAFGFVEHHFNGMLTNKIPMFNRLNWHLVAGANAYYVNKNSNYFEIFTGLENIFKVLRVDVVAGYLNGRVGEVNIRLGLGGLLGGKFSFTD